MGCGSLDPAARSLPAEGEQETEVEAEIVLLRALGLLVGVPGFLLGVFWLLDRLEAWVVKPDEHAAEVQALLVQAEEAEDVEEAVARMLAPFDATTARRGRMVLPRPVRRRRGGRWRGMPASAGQPATGQRPEEAGKQLRRREALADAEEALLEGSAREAAAFPPEHADDGSSRERP